jgi:protein subunit release factor A
MSAVIVEIRAAEGGADAKLLVRQQLEIYLKWGARRGL